MNVLLPAFRLPTIASFIISGGAFWPTLSPRVRSIRSSMSAIPREWVADISIGAPNPSLCSSPTSPVVFIMSTLLASRITGLSCFRRSLATCESRGATPSRASTMNSISDAWATPEAIWSSTSSVRSSTSSIPIPPVSTSSMNPVLSSIGAETLSLVTPGVSSTIDMRRPAMMFRRLDLPTLGRPTMATIGKDMAAL